MSLRSYVGFQTATNRITISDTVDPRTAITSISYGGIFNISKEDYDYTRQDIGITSSRAVTSGTSPTTVPSPTSNNGDLLLAFCCSRPAARTFSSPGWTVEAESTTEQPSLSILSKRSSGSEPSSYDFTLSGASDSFDVIIISIANCNLYTIGTFGSQNNPPTISVPDDSSTEKLILFFIGNDGGNRSWDINTINEFQIESLTSIQSSDVSAIYRTSSNTSLSYTTTQVGGGSNSYGISVVLRRI